VSVAGQAVRRQVNLWQSSSRNARENEAVACLRVQTPCPPIFSFLQPHLKFVHVGDYRPVYAFDKTSLSRGILVAAASVLVCSIII
jgi:hypothetical protein